LLASDPTIDELYLTTADPEGRFSGILLLGRRGEFSFQTTDLSFVMRVLKELGNSQLYSTILSQVGDSPTLWSVISRLSFSDDDLASSASALEFVALHFDEMTIPLFESLSLPLAEAILSEPGLRLKSEDFLYDLISSRFDENPEFFGLLERVHFEYLSQPVIARVLERRFELFQQLNPAIWDSFCNRLAQSARPIAGTAVGDEDGNFYGIIAGLTARYGGNVHEKGIVTVSASPIGSGALSNVVDFSSEYGLSTESRPFVWLCYDFKDRIVSATGISLLLGAEMVPVVNASKLSFQTSADGSNWTGLSVGGSSCTERNPRLCLLRCPATFPAFRFARLRIADKGLTVPLSVISWEIFGHVWATSGDEGVSATPATDANRHAQWQPRGTVRRGTARNDFGVCAGGRPLPAEFDGMAQFLNRAAEGNVQVSALLALPGMAANLAQPFHETLEMLMIRGAVIHQNSSYVQIHFPHHRVRVTHYAVGARLPACSLAWELRCSNDGAQWTTVDERTPRNISPDWVRPSVQTCELATPIECSFVRIQLPGIGVESLSQAGFEVFGSVLD
jgi:hypothetical protein